MANTDWAPIIGIGLLGVVGVYFFINRNSQPFQVGDRVIDVVVTSNGVGTVTRVFFFDEANGWLCDVLFDITLDLIQAIPAGHLRKFNG